MDEMTKTKLVNELREALILKGEVIDSVLNKSLSDEALILNLILDRVVSPKEFHPWPLGGISSSNQRVEKVPELKSLYEPCNRILKHNDGIFHCILHQPHPPDGHLFQLPDVDTQIEDKEELQ